jgi:hypothetical protein
MKKKFLAMLMLIILSAASMNAQVTIGTDANPHDGAILDLQSTTQGLLLPKVQLDDADEFQLAGDEMKAIGMMVYNIKAGVKNGYGAGVYVWDGGHWNIVNRQGGTDETFNPNDYPITPPANVTCGINGDPCFDVRESLVASSSYPLSVTGATISSTVWDIQDPKGVLSGSANTGNVNAVLPFKPQATVKALALPATVTVTAYITFSTGDKVKVTKEIKFQNASCCEGTIIYDGAWRTPPRGSFTSGLNGYYSADWNNTGLFGSSAIGHLCWYKHDTPNGSTANWADAMDSSCPANFRLPNLKELHELYKAFGGSGYSATNFATAVTAGRGEMLEATTNMLSDIYYSSTEIDKDNAYRFVFSNGVRNSNSKTFYSFPVRCVRTL